MLDLMTVREVAEVLKVSTSRIYSQRSEGHPFFAGKAWQWAVTSGTAGRTSSPTSRSASMPTKPAGDSRSSRCTPKAPRSRRHSGTTSATSRCGFAETSRRFAERRGSAVRRNAPAAPTSCPHPPA